MTKQEFKEFCHNLFIEYGFIKKRNMYYLEGKDLLCGLYLQKSMSEAYYVEFDFFIGEYNNIKKYPTTYESDIYRRITVLSKNTINGKQFMSALINYELYTKEELEPYFIHTFEKYIMPPILKGKIKILDDKEYYFKALFPEELDNVLKKLDIN